MADEQIALSFGKGITNVPGDATCDDNELEECLGMTYSDGEHRPIQAPRAKFTNVGGKILYVHRSADSTNGVRYIYMANSGHQLRWFSSNPSSSTLIRTMDSDDVQITSIGKTLIVSDGDGLHYFLWKSGSYKDLGNNIPELQVEFAMSKLSSSGQASLFTNDGSITWNDRIVKTGKSTGILNGGIDSATIVDQKAYNDLVIGLYSECKKEISTKKAFCLPFFLRVALELYDGSYTHISQPILMLPSITRNTFMCWTYNNNNEDSAIELRTSFSYLYYRSSYDYTEWSDIVKGVTVFISEPMEINNIWSNLPNPVCLQAQNLKLDRIVGKNYHSVYEKEVASTLEYEFYVFDKRDELEVTNEVTSTSVFYKLANIGMKGTGIGSGYDHQGWNALAGQIETRTIENITTQDRLPNDDYYSYCSLHAKYLYAYNGRLNIANVSRGFFDGFGFFMPYDWEDGSTGTLQITVKIETDSGTRYVQKQVQTKQIISWWFFYPDPRATFVWVKKINSGGTVINLLKCKLKEHQGLHGAYCFFGFPSANDSHPSDGTSGTESFPSSLNYTPEPLNSYLLQSEVNNPFVFRAEGYHMIGDGNILGMSTQTVALSQGQFGKYPLIVFTDEGLWGLSVDQSSGIYLDANPFSREVCNNSRSITQTDGAVFFTSEKGLMMVVGSEVTCVSEQMSGATGAFSNGGWSVVSALGHFNTFLKSCFIAYDYRDSLLWLFDGEIRNGNIGLRYCYVYAIKSGTFAKYDFGANSIIKSVCNDYPDYLLQSGSNVYSLTGRVDINADSGTYNGSILTRPMKFNNALALKSIRRMNLVKRFNTNGAVSFKVFASNDLQNWADLQSLRCMPWKYYRFLFVFTSLKATDRFAGAVVVTQERRTNKLR